MIHNYGKIKIFAERDLDQFLEQIKIRIISSIEGERDDYLLNVNEEDYIKHKISEATIEQLQIHTEDLSVSSTERMIPAEYFPFGFDVRSGGEYKKDVIKFHLPFSGNSELINCTPSSRLMRSMEIEIIGNEICFETINFKDDIESITREKDQNIQSIIQQLGNVKAQIDIYNNSLDSKIREVFNNRKQRILKKSDVLASLGIPIKKAIGVPSTFSIPTPQTKKSITVSRPIVNESGFKPEPTLNDETYNDILRLIHDVGKEFERLPSLYKDKEEEHLRDHFLMILEPHFDGSATGETFNKIGKTDILLRYEGHNVFIAECKFWHGEKMFLEAITQLLGYLSWRDSKASIILFVQNKDFSSVINTVKEKTNQHPNYIDFKGANDETWLNYTFHINNDRNRLVRLAVMLYHIPN